MTTRTIRWRGNEILKQLDGATPAALFAGGTVILTEAMRRVPRRTGRLHDSGYVGSTERSTYVRRRGYKREKHAKEGWAVVGFAARHSHLVESGTRRTRKRPYLRPALNAKAEETARTIAQRMGKSLT